MSLYNEDELSGPSWLNEEFLRQVLREYQNNEKLEVVSFALKPGCMKGDHLASVMLNVKVSYRNTADVHGPVEKISLVLKTIPEAKGMKQRMLQEAKFFETEIGMYTETLPAIEKILAQYGDQTKFGPRVIYSALTPNKVVIFEDLCEQGYNTVRGRFLSEEEVRPVILKLAKLHAVSYMLGKSEKAQSVTKYEYGLCSNTKIFEGGFIKKSFKLFVELLEHSEELREYAPKFKDLQEEIFKETYNLYCAKQNGVKDEIYVLNHGDLHLKNMMYKYNKKAQCDDVMMVDFQMSVFAPSALDLTYGNFMLFSSKIRHEQRNQMLHYYFENFIATLKKIEYKGVLPKYSQFQISTIRHRYFAMFMIPTLLPLLITLLAVAPEDMQDIDTSTALDSEKFFESIYEDPALIDELKLLLPTLLKDGFLD